MFLYVYVADPDNAATKSWLAPGCSRQPGLGEGASNRRCTFNRVRLLFVSR
jgi:hypothetical protein